jgi:hypothetical protein
MSEPTGGVMSVWAKPTNTSHHLLIGLPSHDANKIGTPLACWDDAKGLTELLQFSRPCPEAATTDDGGDGLCGAGKL